jgi:hypothetical protein
VGFCIRALLVSMQFAPFQCHVILSSVASLDLPYFSTLSHTRHDLGGGGRENTKSCFHFFYKFCLKYLIPKTLQWGINMYKSLCINYPPFMLDFNETNFIKNFWNFQIPNFMKILPVGSKFFQVNMKKLIRNLFLQFCKYTSQQPRNYNKWEFNATQYFPHCSKIGYVYFIR